MISTKATQHWSEALLTFLDPAGSISIHRNQSAAKKLRIQFAGQSVASEPTATGAANRGLTTQTLSMRSNVLSPLRQQGRNDDAYIRLDRTLIVADPIRSSVAFAPTLNRSVQRMGLVLGHRASAILLDRAR